MMIVLEMERRKCFMMIIIIPNLKKHANQDLPKIESMATHYINKCFFNVKIKKTDEKTIIL
jgi:hypothetical protein